MDLKQVGGSGMNSSGSTRTSDGLLWRQ